MNAINKPNEVSMFKVGDKAVFTDIRGSCVITYDGKSEGPLKLHWLSYPDGTTGYIFSLDRIRHATPEEIAAGHRIESSNSQAISDCSVSNLCQNDTQNSLPIKQGNQDMGDDTHIENHVSPLCKVGVK